MIRSNTTQIKAKQIELFKKKRFLERIRPRSRCTVANTFPFEIDQNGGKLCLRAQIEKPEKRIVELGWEDFFLAMVEYFPLFPFTGLTPLQKLDHRQCIRCGGVKWASTTWSGDRCDDCTRGLVLLPAVT